MVENASFEKKGYSGQRQLVHFLGIFCSFVVGCDVASHCLFSKVAASLIGIILESSRLRLAQNH